MIKNSKDGDAILQDEIKIEIAGICLLLRIKYPGIKEKVAARYRDFLSNRKQDIVIDVESFDFLKPRFRALIFQDSSWKLYRENEYFFLEFSIRPRCALAKFDVSMRKIKLYIDVYPCGRQLIYPFFERLFRWILSRHHAIMLHACGVVDGKMGHLFIAPSGGGKSTMAKLALKEGLNVLNDDRVIIRKKGKRFIMYGNPWHGEVCKTANISSPFKEVFFLRKSTSNRIAPINKTKALAMYLKSHFSSPLNGRIRERFNPLFELTENLKCYWLEFKPDKTIWRFLDGMV